MEEIEYLEEYEDLILPSVDAGALPSSGVVDDPSMDNILDLLDEHSNILQSKVGTNLSQRGCDDRASLDSLDLLYKDLVGEELLQPTSTVATAQPTTSSSKATLSQTEQPKDRISALPSLITPSTSHSEQRSMQRGNSVLHMPSSSLSLSGSSNLRGRNTPSQLNRTAGNQTNSSSTHHKNLPAPSRTATQRVDRFKSVATVRPTLHRSALGYSGRFYGTSSTSKQLAHRPTTSSVHSANSGSNNSNKYTSRYNFSNKSYNKRTPTPQVLQKVRPPQTKSFIEDPLSLDDLLDTCDSDDDSDLDSLNDFPDLDDSDDFSDSDSDDYDSSSNNESQSSPTIENANVKETSSKPTIMESRHSKTSENGTRSTDSATIVKDTQTKRTDQLLKTSKNVILEETRPSTSVRSEKKSSNSNVLAKPVENETQIKPSDPLAENSKDVTTELCHSENLGNASHNKPAQKEFSDSANDIIENIVNNTAIPMDSSEEAAQDRVTLDATTESAKDSTMDSQDSPKDESGASISDSVQVANEKNSTIYSSADKSVSKITHEVEKTALTEHESLVQAVLNDIVGTSPTISHSNKDHVTSATEVTNQEVTDNETNIINESGSKSLLETEKENILESLHLKEVPEQQTQEPENNSIQNSESTTEENTTITANNEPSANDEHTSPKTLPKEKICREQQLEEERSRRKLNTRLSRCGIDSENKADSDFKRRKVNGDDEISKRSIDQELKKVKAKSDCEEFTNVSKEIENSHLDMSKLIEQKKHVKMLNEPNDLKDGETENEPSKSHTQYEMETTKLFAVTEEKKFKLKSNMKSSLRKSSSELDAKNDSMNDSLNETTKSKQVRFKLNSPDDLEYIPPLKKRFSSRSLKNFKPYDDSFDVSDGSKRTSKPLIRPSILFKESLISESAPRLSEPSKSTNKNQEGTFTVAQEILPTKQITEEKSASEEPEKSDTPQVNHSSNSPKTYSKVEESIAKYNMNSVLRVNLRKLPSTTMKTKGAEVVPIENRKSSQDKRKSAKTNRENTTVTTNEICSKSSDVSTEQLSNESLRSNEIEEESATFYMSSAKNNSSDQMAKKNLDISHESTEKKTMIASRNFGTRNNSTVSNESVTKKNQPVPHEPLARRSPTVSRDLNPKNRSSVTTVERKSLTVSKELLAKQNPPSSSEPMAKNNTASQEPTITSTPKLKNSKNVSTTESLNTPKIPARKSKRKSAGVNNRISNTGKVNKADQKKPNLMTLRVILDRSIVEKYLNEMRSPKPDASKTRVNVTNSGTKKTRSTSRRLSGKVASSSPGQNTSFDKRINDRMQGKPVKLPENFHHPPKNSNVSAQIQINELESPKKINEFSLLTPIKTGRVYSARKSVAKVSQGMPQKGANVPTTFTTTTTATTLISATSTTTVPTTATRTTTTPATLTASTTRKQATTIEHSILPDVIQPKLENDKDERIPYNADSNSSPIVQPLMPAYNACRSYTFQTPAKKQRNSGALLLDYCCPSIENSSINADTNFWSSDGSVKTIVRELPSYIVMEAKIITQAELRANKNLIPAPVLQKMHKLHHLVSTDTNPNENPPSLSNQSSEFIAAQAQQKQQPPIESTITTSSAILPSLLTPTTSTTLAIISTATTSSTTTSSTTTTSSSLVTQAAAPTMEVANSLPVANRNSEVKKEMYTICKHIDLLLRKHASSVLSMTMKERQHRLMNVAANASLTMQDAASAYAILQQYFDGKFIQSPSEQVPILDKKKNIIGYQMKDTRYVPYPANSSPNVPSITNKPTTLSMSSVTKNIPTSSNAITTSCTTSATTSNSTSHSTTASKMKQHYTASGKPVPVGQSDSPRIFFTKPPYLSKNIVVKPVNSSSKHQVSTSVNKRSSLQKKLQRRQEVVITAPTPTLTSTLVTTVTATQQQTIPKATISKTPPRLIIVTKEQKTANQQNKDEMILPDDEPVAQRIKTEQATEDDCMISGV